MAGLATGSLLLFLTPPGWVEHTFPRQTYTVSFPRPSLQQAQPIMGATAHIAVVDCRGMMLLVQELKLPPAPQGPAYERDLMAGLRDGTLASLKAKLLSERRLTVSGASALEMEFEVPGGKLARARYVLGDDAALFAVIVMFPDRRRAGDPEAGQFLESFRLNGSTPPTVAANAADISWAWQPSAVMPPPVFLGSGSERLRMCCGVASRET